MEIFEQSTLLCEQKLLTSRQISGTPYRLVPSQKALRTNAVHGCLPPPLGVAEN